MNNLILNHPRWILAGSVLLLLAAAAFLPGLRNDSNPELLPADHASRVAHEQLKDTYTGNQDVVVVMLQHAQTVFNSATLARVRALSTGLADIALVLDSDRRLLAEMAAAIPASAADEFRPLTEDVDDRANGELALTARRLLKDNGRWTPALQAGLDRYLDHLHPVIRVHSISETDNIVARDGDLLVRPAYAPGAVTAQQLAAVRDEVMANELFEDLLVSRDGKSTGIYVELSLAVEDADAAQLFLQQVNGLIARVPGEEQVFVAGMPVTTSTISRVIDADMGSLFPVVLVVVLLLLWLSFLDLKGVGLPIVVVITSLVCTLGVMAALEVPLNVITASLPVFLISIGIADGVHFFAEYRAQYHLFGDKRVATSKTLGLLAKPIVLTSLTTAVAFWSLTFTEIAEIAWFGVFVALGTLLAMVFSLTLLPAMAVLLPPPAIASLSQQKRPGIGQLVEGGLRRLDRAAAGRVPVIVLVMAGLFLTAAYGALQVRFDNNRVAFFANDSTLVTSVKAIRSQLAGSEVLNVNLRALDGSDQPFRSPHNLAFLDQLERFAERQPHVGASVSLAKLVRRMNLVMHDNDPAYQRVPMATTDDRDGQKQVRQLIAQYLFLYENGGGDLLTDVVDSDYSQTNLKLYLKTNSSTEIAALMATLNDYLQRHLPVGIEAGFAGNGTLLVAAGQEIILGQVRSLLLCIFIVAALLVFQFRSARQGLLAFLPLVFAVTVNFGLLGFLGINIDIGTAIVSSIAIGIGVDFSIHYLCRYNFLKTAGHPAADAIAGAVVTAGKAISYNVLVVGSGFLTLLASGFVPITTIGWLVALSLLISALATLLLIPALLRLGTVPAPRLLPDSPATRSANA